MIDRVSILSYTSDDPLGRLLDFMRFAKGELRGIEDDARVARHSKTLKQCEECIALLDKLWQSALHNNSDPTQPYTSEKGVHDASRGAEDCMFDLMVRRDWGW